MNLACIEQRAKNRRRKIAAVATEGRLHAASIGGDESRDDQRSLKFGGNRCLNPIL